MPISTASPTAARVRSTWRIASFTTSIQFSRRYSDRLRASLLDVAGREMTNHPRFGWASSPTCPWDPVHGSAQDSARLEPCRGQGRDSPAAVGRQVEHASPARLQERYGG